MEIRLNFYSFTMASAWFLIFCTCLEKNQGISSTLWLLFMLYCLNYKLHSRLLGWLNRHNKGAVIHSVYTGHTFHQFWQVKSFNLFLTSKKTLQNSTMQHKALTHLLKNCKTTLFVFFSVLMFAINTSRKNLLFKNQYKCCFNCNDSLSFHWRQIQGQCANGHLSQSQHPLFKAKLQQTLQMSLEQK